MARPGDRDVDRSEAGLAGVVVSMSLSAYGFDSAYYELPENASISIAAEENLAALDTIAGQRYENDILFRKTISFSLRSIFSLQCNAIKNSVL